MKKIFSALCMALLAGGMIFTSCTKQQYTITVEANPIYGGSVKGGGTFNVGDSTTLKAIANDGYKFVRWQDNDTNRTRHIVVMTDATYTAYFEKILDETGVNVSFNGYSWTAHEITGVNDTIFGWWNVYAMENRGSLPIADIATYVMNGSIHAVADTVTGSLISDIISRVEYYDYTFLQDPSNNTIHGDYWAKNATVTVSAFDPTTLQLTANIIATMFNAYEAFIDTMGVDSASTAEMWMDIRQLKLQPVTTNSSKKLVGKLIPGKPGQAPSAAIKPRR